MPAKCEKLLLVGIAVISWAGIASAQDATNRPGADPTEIIHAIFQDPEIKNFAGPSENAWDFSNPESVPGFGPLPPTGNAQ